jgi:uncharacterized membrane protein
MEAATTGPATGRIALIDAARGVALLAMAVYHFTWDLEFFGYADPGLTSHGGWRLFARAIASSFLVLAGISLFLAHGNGLRGRSFLRRFYQVAGAAAAISLVTRIAFPDAFIYFGILHQIAFASLVGLVFLHAPFWLTLVAAGVIVILPQFVSSPVFDPRWFAWTGLAENAPRSNDFVPVLPWTGAVLAGLGLAQAILPTPVRARLASLRLPAPSRILGFAGRHSLLFYLVHQPILIGLVWTASQLFPPKAMLPETRFLAACARSCEAVRDAEFCGLYCACTLDALVDADMLNAVIEGKSDAPSKQAQETIAETCTRKTDDALEAMKP